MERRHFIKNSALAIGTSGLVSSAITPTEAFESLDTPVAEGPLDQPSPLRFRQIHLDFHTSGQIPDIAVDFDAEKFAYTLKKASVNSVTVFGRCHHGYIYHETDKYPERRHPFSKNPRLLEEQIEACHKQNIRTPIYVTVQWDEFTSHQHPEWLMRDDKGQPFGNTTFEAGFYRHLCIHTPYLDFLKSYLAELFEKVPVQGLFLDIHHVWPNANEECLAGMKRLGLDASNPEIRLAYYQNVMDEYKQDLSAFIWKMDKKCAVFFNSGHVGPGTRKVIDSYSHLELESLPSGGWGYLHFPLTSRYARTLGKDMLGMTGKFHTSWGDFHSLKNKAALEFECFSMLALNAKCSVGDQLHPKGALDSATYDLIGSVYSQVAQKESWCTNATPIAEIGVFSAEEFAEKAGSNIRTPEAMMGVVRMLQEGRQQFDVIDSYTDLSPYKLLILPDNIPVEEPLLSKLEQFITNGGSVISSHYSGLNSDRTAFTSSLWGLDYVGDAPYSPDFLALNGTGIGASLPATELVMYLQGTEVKPTGANVLVWANIPYFNRTWEHYSSHRHTPSSGKPGYPAVVQNGKVIYFIHPLFTQYARNAPRWCREVFLNAVKMLLPSPVVQLKNAPTTVLSALNEQKEEKRYVLHLLSYIPERRGSDFDVLEDVVPLAGMQADLGIAKPVKKVRLVPQGKTLSFSQKNGRVSFSLPEWSGHQMVDLLY